MEDIEVGNDPEENVIGTQHERNRNIVQKLTIMSDMFMRNVFKNLACTELILQVIMENEDLYIMEQVVQMDYKNLQGRSAILDCLARDSEDRHYNVEVENEKKRGKPKRARYHSGLIDMNTLKPGQDTEELPETYVIFITEKDVLGGNQPIYHIDRKIEEMNEYFPDSEHILYVNSQIQDDTPLGRLMHDFHCENADDMYNEVLANRVRELKETPEGVNGMCKELEELYEEGVELGRKQGFGAGLELGKTEERT